MRNTCLKALLAGLGLLHGAVGACPSRAPAGMTVTPVGDEVSANGMAMALSQVQGSESAEAVLAHTEKVWKEEGYDVRRAQAAGWTILAAKSAQCLTTLQLVERKGAFGYLARSRKPAGAVPGAAAMGVPLPPDAQVTSSVGSVDDGRKGVVLALSSHQSTDELNRYFMEELARNGWSATRSHRISNRKTGAESIFVTAQRRREQVEIVMWREQATQVVLAVSEAL
jgi:hypothetical protein